MVNCSFWLMQYTSRFLLAVYTASPSNSKLSLSIFCKARLSTKFSNLPSFLDFFLRISKIAFLFSFIYFEFKMF